MYRRQNQSQQSKIESENPAFDRQSFYDDIIDLDQATYGPHDVADDGACYDELTDLDNGANETYDHPDAVPGPSTPLLYQGLNAANTTYDKPDAGPALPDRPAPNQYQNVNQETTKPTTTPAYLEPNVTPDYLVPTITPNYLELINEDEEQNQTAVPVEPATAPAYLELIHVDEDKNQTAEC